MFLQEGIECPQPVFDGIETLGIGLDPVSIG